MFRWDETQMSFYNHNDLWNKLIPEDSIYRLFRELAPQLINPNDFENLYSRDNGRPSLFALRMTLACLLQQMHGSSDREMEQQTQVNLEFKYALGMGLDEPGIDACSLLVHRQRLIEKGLDKSLLQRFIYLLYCLGILTGKEPFLTDTTHSIAPVSEQSALSLIQQSLSLVLRRLEAKGERDRMVEETRGLAINKGKWANDNLPEIVKTIDDFLTWLKQQYELEQDPALQKRVGCLGRIMKERVIRRSDGSVEISHSSTVKDLVMSAHDVEARFGCKGKTHWRGYKIASIQVGNTGFLAASEVLAANQYDGDSLAPLVDSLPLSQVEEPTVIGDAHYGAAEQRIEMQQRKIRVIAPATKLPPGLTPEEEGFSVSDDLQKLICRQGHCWSPAYRVKYGYQFHLLNTSKSPCPKCPFVDQCFGRKKRRTVFIHQHYQLISGARQEMKTSTYKESMKLRKQIEAKQNELVNHYGLRRTNYLGKRNLAYAARMRSLCSNICRLQRMLNDPKKPQILDWGKLKSTVCLIAV